ncbi:MAG: 4Fe-4S dicluster domain-containing protein, partial [Acidobacteriota bacterium]
QEILDLRLDFHGGGLFCQHCGTCLSGCQENLPLPSLMRSYMYAYGYRNPGLARDLLEELRVPANACRDCDTCTVRCVKGFDVASRVQEIVRLREVPADFFA